MDRISTLLIIEDIDIYLKNMEKEDRTLQHMKEIFLKLHRSRVSLDGFIFLLPSPPNGECWDILHPSLQRGHTSMTVHPKTDL